MGPKRYKKYKMGFIQISHSQISKSGNFMSTPQLTFLANFRLKWTKKEEMGNKGCKKAIKVRNEARLDSSPNGK